MNVDDKPKSISCEQCDYKAKNNDGLNEHNAKEHNKTEFQFKCNECTYRTSVEDYLRGHIVSTHYPLAAEKLPMFCNV